MTEGWAALTALGISIMVLTAYGTLLVTVGVDGCLVVMGTWPFVLWGVWLLAMKALTRKRPIH